MKKLVLMFVAIAAISFAQLSLSHLVVTMQSPPLRLRLLLTLQLLTLLLLLPTPLLLTLLLLLSNTLA